MPLFSTDDLNVHHRTDHLSNTISYEDKDVYSRLKEIRLRNSNRIVIAHLNINSLRNKFDMLSDLIYGNIDILLLTETKLDSSFPSLNFQLNGFKNPFRRDRSIHGGGIILYIREDILPSYCQVSTCLKIANVFSSSNTLKTESGYLGVSTTQLRVKYLRNYHI